MIFSQEQRSVSVDTPLTIVLSQCLRGLQYGVNIANAQGGIHATIRLEDPCRPVYLALDLSPSHCSNTREWLQRLRLQVSQEVGSPHQGTGFPRHDQRQRALLLHGNFSGITSHHKFVDSRLNLCTFVHRWGRHLSHRAKRQTEVR